MRIVFDWGDVNRLTVDIGDEESTDPKAFEYAARHIAEVCEARGLEQIQLQVMKTEALRELFTRHLCNMKFTMVALSGPSVIDYDILVYRRHGVNWTSPEEKVANG